MSTKAVIDTNVFVSAFLSKNREAPPARIYRAMIERHFTPLYCDEIMAEYDEVLHRNKFGFPAAHVDAAIRAIREFGEEISPATPGDETFPDPDDKIFYCVALAAQDDLAKLVTGNSKHYPTVPFVVTPAEFAESVA